MSKPKVYVTRNIPQIGLDILSEKFTVSIWESDDPVTREALLQGVREVDALLCLLTDKIDQEVIDNAVNLKVVSTLSVGYNHINLDACKKRQIRVGNTPNVSTEAVAEMGMALMLACGRRLVEANAQVLNGGWTTWKPIWMCGKGMEGSTVGVVGLGRIGFAIAVKCQAFKPQKIVYYDLKRIPPAEAFDFERLELNELLQVSDYVVCCCALTLTDRNLFDKDAFDNMKDGSIFINVSRGDQVDHEALYKSLDSGKLAAAGLDVTTPEPFPSDHPLAKLPNCIITPHVASATIAARDRMAVLAAQNIIAAIEGEPMPAPVLFE